MEKTLLVGEGGILDTTFLSCLPWIYTHLHMTLRTADENRGSSIKQVAKCLWGFLPPL